MILMGFIAVLNLFFLIGVGGILWVKIYILVLVLFYIGKILYDSSHPLYAFGNLWEKIQKLTPKIEEKSHEVQDNFQNDMNFWVLSDGFDSLSSDFSEIISLVIRIEKVEKRANKWNLFDSEKYINSLRSDIVKPLKFLKSFFEEQKAELLNSQKEFQKVRIGWLSELSSWSELSSKRNELILVELTENIGKLDEMIEKIW